MKVELELWHVLVLLTSLLGAFWGMAKFMLAQNEKAIDEKAKASDKTLADNAKSIAESFAAITGHLKRQDESQRHTEGAVNELRLELARDYVRREDYAVAIASIMNKIDGLALRMEDLFRAALRGGTRHE